VDLGVPNEVLVGLIAGLLVKLPVANLFARRWLTNCHCSPFTGVGPLVRGVAYTGLSAILTVRLGTALEGNINDDDGLPPPC